jgi:arginine-tRNA-protein transferase
MKFGVTQAFPCNYLEDQNEQLLVCMEENDALSQDYSTLIQVGFRRSGEQLYRPHCKNCQACESLRVLVSSFAPSKSQKRVINKNKDVQIKIVDQERDDYYPLYERYISASHQDGSMYPPSYEQYRNFIHCQWQSPIFIEGRIDNKLIGVAVTDEINGGLSALYTFFEPSLAKRSLGTFFITQQIKACQKANLPYLYLGYQIDKCNKMNYKNKFYPHQRFIENKWILFTQDKKAV